MTNIKDNGSDLEVKIKPNNDIRAKVSDLSTSTKYKEEANKRKSGDYSAMTKSAKIPNNGVYLIRKI
jgi:hypothetical protein